MVPLPDGELPFIADVYAAGLLPRPVTERTERAECTEGTEDHRGLRKQLGCVGGETPLKPTNGSVPSVLSVTSADGDEIERAIQESFPKGIGRRNFQVFDLARALKAIPRLADAPANALEPHVRRWHQIGVETGVIGTEPFEETLIDFLRAWPKVRFPKGCEPMVAILRQAKNTPLPAAAKRYEQEKLQLLVAVCRELQTASGDKPFFLACRTAARLLELHNLKGEEDHVKAWRWLFLLIQDRVLEEVEKGNQSTRHASRYRYLGD